MELLADTGFLIDLWREQGKSGPAARYARLNADKSIGISWVVAGEFLSGSSLAGQDTKLVESFLDRYPIVYSDRPTIAHYSTIYAELRKRNALIGPNDLWIAASALAHQVPLVTRNASEFRRVQSLTVVDYANL